MSKRKKPEQTYWSDVNIDVLPLKDLRVLLQNRKVGNLPGKRSELEALLTKKDVEIDYNDSFTIRQLQVELRLRGLDDTTAKKKVYLQRLRGEVAAPAKKKLRKGQRKKRQHKALGTKVHVAFYQSPIDDSKKDDEDTKVLGIFSSQQNAYNLLVDKLLEDLKKKDDKASQDMEKERKEKGASRELVERILDKCVSSFGEDKQPNGWVTVSKVE